MCNPAAMMMASTAFQVAGQAYAGYSAYTEQRYQAGVAKNNAKLSREQAADAIARGDVAQQNKGREVAQIRSAQIAQMAASGIDTSTGSAADLTGDTGFLGMEDQRIIRENADRETRGFNIQAQNFNEQAKGHKRAATGALISTAFQIGSTIMGGAKQLTDMKLPTPKSAPSPGPSSAGYSAWGAPYLKTT